MSYFDDETNSIPENKDAQTSIVDPDAVANFFGLFDEFGEVKLNARSLAHANVGLRQVSVRLMEEASALISAMKRGDPEVNPFVGAILTSMSGSYFLATVIAFAAPYGVLEIIPEVAMAFVRSLYECATREGSPWALYPRRADGFMAPGNSGYNQILFMISEEDREEARTKLDAIFGIAE